MRFWLVLSLFAMVVSSFHPNLFPGRLPCSENPKRGGWVEGGISCHVSCLPNTAEVLIDWIKPKIRKSSKTILFWQRAENADFLGSLRRVLNLKENGEIYLCLVFVSFLFFYIISGFSLFYIVLLISLHFSWSIIHLYSGFFLFSFLYSL